MGKIIPFDEFEKTIGYAPPNAEISSKKKKIIPFDEFEKTIGYSKPDQEVKNKSPLPDEDALKKLAKEKSTLEALTIGVGRGFMDIGQGVKQLALKGAEKVGLAKKGTSDQYTNEVNKELELFNALEREKPVSAIGGRILGGIAATAPIGLASVPSKLVGGVVKRAIATGAAQGAITGGLEYDPTNDSRFKNAAIGGTIGTLLPAAFMGGRRILRGKDVPGNTKTSQELGQLSKELGVDLTVPELRNSVGGKTFESYIEKVPGTGYVGFREKQVEQLKNAANKIKENIGGDVGDDYGITAKNSLQDVLKENKNAASKQFDKVGKIADELGGKINFSNTENTAKNIMNDISDVPDIFIDKKIADYASKFSNIEELPFNTARKLRSQLGDEVSKLKKAANNGTAQANEYRYASQLFDSLEKDMDSFAEKAGGNLGKEYSKAREFYKDRVVPFKKGNLARQLKDDGDTDQLIGSFLKPNRPNLASKLIENSTDKGKTAIRASIIDEAFNKASQGEFFNPSLFIKDIKRLGKSNKVVFTPQQNKMFDGYDKISKAANRASEFAKNPETGVRLANVAAGLVGYGGAAAIGLSSDDWKKGVGALAFGLGGAKLMKSEAGRKLLTRAFTTPEKNKKAWLDILGKAVKISSVVQGTNADNYFSSTSE